MGVGALGTFLQVWEAVQPSLPAQARPFFSPNVPALEVQLAAHFDVAWYDAAVHVTQQMLVVPAQSESSSQAKPSPIGHGSSDFVHDGKGANALKQHTGCCPEHATCAEHCTTPGPPGPVPGPPVSGWLASGTEPESKGWLVSGAPVSGFPELLPVSGLPELPVSG